MTSIDILNLTRQFFPDRDEPLSRGCFAPRLGKIRPISGGPSPQSIAEAMFFTVPSELARTLGLFYDFGNDRTENKHLISKVPVQFILDSGEDKRHIAVFVQSIDAEPDYSLYPKKFFKGRPKGSKNDRQVALCGLYVELEAFQKIGKKKLKELPFKQCFIAYDLEYRTGTFADICEVDEPPSTQVIKSLDVLHQVVNKHFIGGFVESFNPTKETTWGYVTFSNHSCPDWITVGALKGSGVDWKFNRPDRSDYHLNLVGVTVPLPGTYAELSGDTVLASDGTILHSYYFSREETIAAMERSGLPPGKIPDTWQDGYYFNRFYPPGSVRVPWEVIESFSREMPEHFRNSLLLERELA